MKRHIKILLNAMIIACYSANIHASAPKINTEHQQILNYISGAWNTLTRSITNCKSMVDPKTHLNTILYLPQELSIPPKVQFLLSHCSVEIRRLPHKIDKLGTIDVKKIGPSGLLYLPNDYIVPGGMFNEMYGWDSYFIIRGLIEEGLNTLAHGMLENFFFEIDHYGAILNANRTYYLTRSQPPFLTSMIKSLYYADLAKNKADLNWLAKAYKYAIRDYLIWTSKPHFDRNSQLSRYYDFSSGPVPELDESSRSYYKDILNYFLANRQKSSAYLTRDKNNHLVLNTHFYKGDRAMRESGFDTSFRFGPFSADTTHFAPVELNALLYKAEADLAWMAGLLKDLDAEKKWQALAQRRKKIMHQLMWNEQEGIYFDYHIKKNKQSTYKYATTFFPLWAGVATKAQAKKIQANLKIFEKSGGIIASPYQTGAQWDYPYNWAPLQLIAVEGLSRYGFKTDAERLSRHYIAMIVKNFKREKTIREKYDAIKTSSQTNVHVGYKINATGFGWTNGVFLVLFNHYANLGSEASHDTPMIE